MAEELKGLIEKIQKDGIKAAEDKAKEIIDASNVKADEIIKSAKKEADRIISDAKAKASKEDESGRAALKQAGRDLIIALRKEINAVLERIAAIHIHKTFTPEEMSRILLNLLKEKVSSGKTDVIISLKKEDVEKLEKSFLADLKEELKRGITLKSSDDIKGGFVISYDGGKSYYDFTDKSLAKYLAYSLRPKLAKLLDGE